MFHTFLAWQVYEDIYKSAWLCRNDAIAMRPKQAENDSGGNRGAEAQAERERQRAGSLHRGSWAPQNKKPEIPSSIKRFAGLELTSHALDARCLLFAPKVSKGWHQSGRIALSPTFESLERSAQMPRRRPIEKRSVPLHQLAAAAVAAEPASSMCTAGCPSPSTVRPPSWVTLFLSGSGFLLRCGRIASVSKVFGVGERRARAGVEASTNECLQPTARTGRRTSFPLLL